ncbi:MAG: nucleotidyltransferase family protein [Nitrososphaerales archaeon]
MDRQLQSEIVRTQVLVMAGGKAKRMGIDLPKCLLEVSGRRLIDWCVESLAEEGFRKFVFLLGHRHALVKEHISNSNYQIEIKYSIDPVSNVALGKGKALKHALQNRAIDRSMRSIMVFPDDIILENNVYSRFLSSHIDALKRNGTIATVILVPGTEYPYGVARVDNKNRIVSFTEKPFIREPTSTGIYAFEPEVYEIVDERIRMEEPRTIELESTILPVLSAERKLSAFFIESDKWLPINTLKEYEHAMKVLA